MNDRVNDGVNDWVNDGVNDWERGSLYSPFDTSASHQRNLQKQ